MNSSRAVLIDWFIEYFHSLLLYPSAPLHLLDNFLVLWAGHRVRSEYHGCISAIVKHCQINWFLQKSRSDGCPGWESLCVFNTPWTFSSLTAEKRLFVSVGITATEKSLYWFDPLSNSSSPFSLVSSSPPQTCRAVQSEVTAALRETEEVWVQSSEILWNRETRTWERWTRSCRTCWRSSWPRTCTCRR